MDQTYPPQPPAPSAAYPVQYSVDYPDRPLNRLITFFRLFVVIPIAIVLSLVEGGFTYGYGGRPDDHDRCRRRSARPAGAADDPVSPEVPALVV